VPALKENAEAAWRQTLDTLLARLDKKDAAAE
jgi:hypothetical protein